MTEFKPGDRVRLSQQGERCGVCKRSKRGTVKSVLVYGKDLCEVTVHRDGIKTPSAYHHSFWELIPVNEMTLDETAAILAKQVLEGNKDAVRPLVDRCLELLNGA